MAYILLILCVLFDARLQAREINSGIWPDHLLYGLRSCIYISVISILGYPDEISRFCFCVLGAGIRFIVFDPALNIWTGKAFNYIGIKDKDDAKSDLFLLKLPYPHITQYVLKFSLLILTITLFIHRFNIQKVCQQLLTSLPI